MSDDYQRIELITGTARRRRWTTEQKLRIIEASCEPGESVSSVARRHSVAPNLLYRWRRLMAQGGAAAVGSDEPVVGNSEVRRLEERIRELESFGLVKEHGPDGARYFDGDDYIVLSIVKDFFRFGVEPRHLTMYKHFEEREADFFESIVMPQLRQRNPDARRGATASLVELARASRKLKQALLRTNLRQHLT